MEWLEKAKAGEFVVKEEAEGPDPQVLMANLRRDMRDRLITEETFQKRRKEIWRMEENTGTGKETAAQLEQLDRYLDGGLIDKEEYRTRKAKIMRES